MNRLHHLKITLAKNISDNTSYPNLEFIVLDYNSSDGLSEFIENTFSREISTGRLKYFRTDQPEKYNMSHSRNMAFRMATGEVLCNIDADNFTGENFSFYVNNAFIENPKIFLTTHTGTKVRGDILGRICVRREHFLKIRGYDERMKHYGFDDYDFVNRLQMLGIAKMPISKPVFLNAIQHSNEERLKNFIGTNLQRLFVSYETPYRSVLIIMFGDGKFSLGTMINNFHQRALTEICSMASQPTFNFSIAENGWVEGTWRKYKKKLCFFVDGKLIQELVNTATDRFDDLGSESIFYEIKDLHTMGVASFFYSQISNRVIMEENLKRRCYAVNQTGFGQGIISNVHSLNLH